MYPPPHMTHMYTGVWGDRGSLNSLQLEHVRDCQLARAVSGNLNPQTEPSNLNFKTARKLAGNLNPQTLIKLTLKP